MSTITDFIKKLEEKEIEEIIDNPNFIFKQFDYAKLVTNLRKEDKNAIFKEFKELFEAKNPKLIKLAFKFNPSLTSKKSNNDQIATLKYCDYYFNIFELILSNENLHTIDHQDAEDGLLLIMSIFREKFHLDFKKFYQKFHEKEIKVKLFFKKKKNKQEANSSLSQTYVDFFKTRFSDSDKIDKMFKMITKVCINNNWFNFLKETYDTCYIQLNSLNNVNFYIVSPIELSIKRVCSQINQTSPSSSDSGNNDYSFGEYKKYYSKIVRNFPDELIQHKIIQTNLNYQWKFVGRFFYYVELFSYIFFLLFFSMASCRLFKQYQYPESFEWITLGIICVNIIFIIKNIIFSRFYYFYSFAHLLEIINMGLCITSISFPVSSINQKTSFWSFSIAYAYINLIFRLEANQMFGSVSYAFRKIMLKSIRVVPIVICLYLGFSFSFNVRSRFITEPGEDYSDYEMHPFGKFVSTNIINLSLMFMGSIDLSKMGLGNNGATDLTLINFFMTDAFIFMMCIFLFNLFVGIAVGEVNDMVKKGEIHLLKVRFDMMHQNICLLSRFGLRVEILHKQFIWEYNKKKKDNRLDPCCDTLSVWFYKLFNWKFGIFSNKTIKGISLEKLKKIINNNNNNDITVEDA